MPKELQNYNIIVTGGTGDLGQALIGELIKNGASVFTNFRDQSKFTTLKKSIGNSSHLFGMKTSLMEQAEVNSFFEKSRDIFKRLDAFFHIMGGFWMGPELADTSWDDWKFMMDLNLNSTFLCTKAAFKIMKAQCSGRIFTISAKTAEEFPPQMGAYVISKSGVLALTRVLANEGKQYNIQANAILPSILDTPANRKSMPDADVNQWVTPKTIARLLVQMCRPESQAVSHSYIKVFGKL
ncbi:MAG: SDR family NAD(P)-dependent oxidoreductase [bacterium]|nr:MAG: SDR family NAD(P)-dependent oxidoreductase [bacterium]